MKKRIVIVECFLVLSLFSSACLDGRNSVLVDLLSQAEVPFRINAIQIIVNDGEEEAFFEFDVPKRVPVADSNDERFAFVLDFAPEFVGTEVTYEIIGLQDGVNVLSSKKEKAFIGRGLVQQEVFISFCGDAKENEFRKEECDDGNLIDGDDCDSNCTVTACGNGIASPGEFCYADEPVELPGDNVLIKGGDVDGDGDIDLIAIIRDGIVTVFLNNGDKSFTEGESFTVENFTGTPAFFIKDGSLDDFDQDNDLDLVIGNDTLAGVEVYLNDGIGNFELASSLSTGSRPRFIETVDFNGDTFTDIISGGTSEIIIFLNNSTGSFKEQKEFNFGRLDSFTIGDVDNDGDFDLVTASFPDNNIGIILNDGNAEFTLIDTIKTTEPNVIALQDINGDGNLDLISGNRRNGFVNDIINVFINKGGGIFDLFDTLDLPAESGVPNNLDFGDFDNDGDIDLIAVGSGRKQDVFLNNGLGQFTFEVSFTADSSRTLAEDLNQDGVPDLIFTGNIFFSTP